MKEKNSKRYINLKIEEIFSNKGNPNQNKFNFNGKKTKTFFLKIIFWILLTTGIIFFLKNKSTNVELKSLNQFFLWQTTHPIISTPIMLDINQDGYIDLATADLSGKLTALDIFNKKEIFKFQLKHGVISPLSKIKIKNHENILVINKEGQFWVVNNQGNYIYQSRNEFFDQPIWNKSVSFKNKTGTSSILFTGNKGKIWKVNSEYGEVIWENSPSLFRGRSILASPVLINYKNQNDIILADESGNVGLIETANGFLKWNKQLKQTIKSSPLLLKKNQQPLIFLISITGQYHFINLQGQEIKRGSIEDEFVSTPNLIYYTQKSKIVLASHQGKVYILNYDDFNQIIIEKTFELNDDSFISSPVLVDLNNDEQEDIVLVSRNGKVILINGKKQQLFFPPFELSSKITATPIIGDVNGDKNLDLVIASEDGKIFFLTLFTNPEKVFKKNIIIYGEFLKNSYNHNNFRSKF